MGGGEVGACLSSACLSPGPTCRFHSDLSSLVLCTLLKLQKGNVCLAALRVTKAQQRLGCELPVHHRVPWRREETHNPVEAAISKPQDSQ